MLFVFARPAAPIDPEGVSARSAALSLNVSERALTLCNLVSTGLVVSTGLNVVSPTP